MDLVTTLTGALTAALILGFLAHRIGLSPIVGYLVAGVAVGPFTPGFVAHSELANEMAEIGIILLLFGVGLNFHIQELLAVRKVAIPGAFVGVGVATALGVLMARLVGWSATSGVVFGLAIAVTSTVVLMRVLGDHQALQTRIGHIAVGWLVVEDLLTVLVLVLLPVLTGPNAATEPIAVWRAVAMALVKVGLLLAFTLVVGKRLVPAILGYIAKTRSRELFTLSVLVLALGIAVGSAKFFGASMALGAFLAGMVVGQSDFSARAASEALPMRDAFAVLFFVSVGMLFDPAQLGHNVGLIALTLAIVSFGKPAAAYILVRMQRYPVAVALPIAASLAQIGEFSFVISALGRKLGVLSDAASQAIVVASMVSITLNPIMFRVVQKVARKSAKIHKPDVEEHDSLDERYRVVVVGYGHIGRTITRLLQENDLVPTVIELNHETIIELKKQGIRAIYGDAEQNEVLLQAGVADAISLIFAASGSPADSIIRAAKELNPTIRVLARTAYARDVAAAQSAGAGVVVSAETEVALAMTEHLLTALGATREQLDEERERVRAELGGTFQPASND